MASIKKLTQKAPCRADFSGGTVDLWPLYLYLGNLELVHMAIPVLAEARFTWKPAAGKKMGKKTDLTFTISSLDLDRRQAYNSLAALQDSLAHSTQDNPLRWVNRLVAHYAEAANRTKPLRGELFVETRSDAPPGSGLGGSSTLGIALAKGLEKIWWPAARRSDPWDLQQTVRDLEAIEIEHPAGDQDYVPALFGGLLIFHLGAHSRRIEKLPAARAKYLGDRCALLYTGKPHHSGINNWQIFMDFHNQKQSTRDALKAIRNLSSEFAEALRKNRTSTFADFINREWELRQQLSPAVCAPVLDEAWDYGRSLGAVARKACGSGGGGTLLLYFPTPQSKKAALSKALPRSDWKWL